MNTIDVDDQVLAELAALATGFHATPNSVLRRILNIQPTGAPVTASEITEPSPNLATTTVLADFVRSGEFQKYYLAIDRYLAVLCRLYSIDAERFLDVALKFRRGSRLYFAMSEKEVLDSGDGVSAKRIPKSPLWALATLDNKAKRFVLESVLVALGYSKEETNTVTAEIPDSGIRRSRSIEVY
jgi:negative regulator of replication initiation